MPELPDVALYLEHLERRVLGRVLEGTRVRSPFLVRTVDPPLRACDGKRVTELSRIGKRLVLGLEDDLFLVIHLMIAGRLRWRDPGAKLPGKLGLAAFDFGGAGTLLLTEASSKKRASLHVVRGRSALSAFDRGGLEVPGSTPGAFAAALRRERHTIKRSLTDPRILAGIGNAYSDEILHRARLSPFALTDRLTDAEIARLHAAATTLLAEWTDRLRADAADAFPEKVTAFRTGFAVHGRYGEPCPACGGPVQRIIYAENEANYCPACQTGGKLLADRVLSRLLGEDWPRTVEELEERSGAPAPGVAPAPRSFGPGSQDRKGSSRRR